MGVHDEFGGVIGRDWRDSTPAWPVRAEPADGAPNVVYVVLDDVGYAQLGCYGSSSTRPTSTRSPRRACGSPTSTPPRCARPRAACLLTGRNHHTNGMGRVADLAMGLSGLLRGGAARERVPLRDPARRTATRRTRWGSGTSRPTTRPTWPPTAAAGPSGAGFDRWYGFHGGETHQFVPTLYCDNHSVQPPRTPAEGYHLTEDLVDHAIEYLSDLPQRRRRATVLPLLRHRRVPLAAPRAAGVDRAVPRRVRRRVGRAPRA